MWRRGIGVEQPRASQGRGQVGAKARSQDSTEQVSRGSAGHLDKLSFVGARTGRLCHVVPQGTDTARLLPSGCVGGASRGLARAEGRGGAAGLEEQGKAINKDRLVVYFVFFF